MTLQEIKKAMISGVVAIDQLIKANPDARVTQAKIDEEQVLQLAMFYDGDMEKCVQELTHTEQWERLPEQWSERDKWIKHIKYGNIQMRNYFQKRPGYCIKCLETVTEFYDGKPTTSDPSGTYCRRCLEEGI